ncbi:hypothetical protein CRI94_16440 [Longibacter salinarum]|uniref:PEGA domain-containing protein n=1 Tax=Longibacter salinarum TaxID=1850348 RepID=A0A2A8CUH3_9BACT|nr:PEGA domain-containing protein [Longibacter salinarum]PEN11178.1 hypothetical protein CRI94_16440 [Longibacter salinarum]
MRLKSHVLRILVATLILVGAWSTRTAILYGQDQVTHATVLSVSDESVTVSLDDGLQVESGVEAVIYGTEETFGQEVTVERGRGSVSRSQDTTAVVSGSDFTDVSAGQRVSFSQVRTVGTLDIRVNPASSTVYLDGKQVTVGNAEVTAETGRRVVKVQSRACRSASKEVQVRRSEATKVSVRLSCDNATAQFDVTPDSATVFVDDQEVGTGDTSASLTRGLHRIRVESPGFAASERTIRVEPGGDETYTFSLKRDLGFASISGYPRGANLNISPTFDGGSSFSERAPISNLELAVGEYEVAIDAEYHKPENVEMRVAGSEQTSLSYSLEPKTYRISIDSEPPGAQIYVDGRQLTGRKTPTTLTLEYGEYDIRLEKDGFRDEEKSVTVRPDTSFQFELDDARIAGNNDDDWTTMKKVSVGALMSVALIGSAFGIMYLGTASTR